MPAVEARLSPTTTAGLLERSARAMPAAAQDNVGGCLLRHSGDRSPWWAQASLLHGDHVTAMLDRAERFAVEHRVGVHVHVCPGCPPDLDDALAARGYRRHTPVIIMTSRPDDVRRQTDGPVAALAPHPGPSWFDEWTQEMIDRVDQPSGYAAVLDDCGAASVGRAVLDAGWVGVFSMRTRARSRRQGYAQAVLTALASWATSRADCLYLQVRQVDEAARRLYASMGFVAAAQYHYRSRGWAR